MELPVPELLLKTLDQLFGRPFLHASNPTVIKGIMPHVTLPDRVTLGDQMSRRVMKTCTSGYLGTLNWRHGWRRERWALDALA